jgi:NAD(P)-dependent dehydrogenase (short-subunit alcohol dehydrogenase family)
MAAARALDRRLVLITGGTRGVGAATARLAAARGYAVAASYRADEAAAAALTASIEAAGGTIAAIRADVSSEREVVRLFAEVDRRFGRLDALVNVVGAAGPVGVVGGAAERSTSRKFLHADSATHRAMTGKTAREIRTNPTILPTRTLNHEP